MKVRPSVPIGIGIAVAYPILFGVLFKLSGVPYTEIADSTANMIKGVIIPVGVMSVLGIIVTILLGWWKPVLRDEERARGWVVIVPIVMLVTLLVGINYGRLGSLGLNLLLLTGVGTLIVGFSEEIAYRGLILVAFRAKMKESHAWFWSALAFALLHTINMFLGLDAVSMGRQVISAFIVGSALYIARRATGLIIVPIILHALQDFSAFTGGDYGLAGTLGMVTMVVAVIALIFGRHLLFGSPKIPEPSTAAS